MKLHHRLIVTAFAAAGAALPPCAAARAASAPTAAAAEHAAPAASASRPDRRLPTAAEKRDDSAATPTPQLRIEGPVKPQIKLPLGRKPVPPRAAQTRNEPATSGAVDDDVARCNAQADETARASCRERLARTQPRR
jgi:hypothetical protein